MSVCKINENFAFYLNDESKSFCVFSEVMEWSRDNVLLEKRLCEHREKCGCVILIFVLFSALCFR